MYKFTNLIPAPDVSPLPSPPELFIFFIVFTFIIHLLFMNLTLGGSILFIISKYFSTGSKKEISKELGAVNTFNISLTITTGIAPLLFYQVVYGQFFYSSSILLGWKWLFVLVAIIAAYYGYYLYKMKPGFLKEGNNDKGGGFIIVSTILFLYVALMLTTNTMLSMQPEKWLDIYLNKASAFSLRAIIPRVLHFIFAAIAFTGVFLMVYSKLKKSLPLEIKESMYDFGKNAFMYATMIQVPVGILFLFSIKSEAMALVMGGSTIGLICWVLGMLSAFYGVYLVFAKKENSFNLSILIVLAIILMVIVRRVVEYGYWSKYFDYSSLKVSPQWDVFGLFALLLVGLLLLLFYILKRNIKELNSSNN